MLFELVQSLFFRFRRVGGSRIVYSMTPSGSFVLRTRWRITRPCFSFLVTK